MTVNELIKHLEYLAEDGFGDVMITGAMQPSWPLRAHIVIAAIQGDDESPDRVIIGAEAGSDYASREAWDEGEYITG